jgi:hypothetical protein
VNIIVENRYGCGLQLTRKRRNREARLAGDSGQIQGFVAMELKNANTFWVEQIFDVNQPYLYVVVLPALIMFALGFRSQAMIFSVGAAAFFTILSVS